MLCQNLNGSNNFIFDTRCQHIMGSEFCVFQNIMQISNANIFITQMLYAISDSHCIGRRAKSLGDIRSMLRWAHSGASTKPISPMSW